MDGPEPRLIHPPEPGQVRKVPEGDNAHHYFERITAWPSPRLEHYLHLVATMLGNGVRKLHTFNTGDFDHFDEIEVLLPTVPQPSADLEES